MLLFDHLNFYKACVQKYSLQLARLISYIFILDNIDFYPCTNIRRTFSAVVQQSYSTCIKYLALFSSLFVKYGY